MAKPSEELFFSHREAADKYDYFVCGAIGAVIAYVSQTGLNRDHGLLATGIEFVGVCLLGAAFHFGVKRIELATTMKALNMRSILAKEAFDALPRSGRAVNEFGKVFSEEQVQSKRRDYVRQSDEAESSMDELTPTGKNHYHNRDLCLRLGILALVLSKLLQTIFPATAAPAPAPLPVVVTVTNIVVITNEPVRVPMNSSNAAR
jgi:hypothetical protein